MDDASLGSKHTHAWGNRHTKLFKGGGVLVEFRGDMFFLMNFELLTFLCRQMIKLSIHI